MWEEIFEAIKESLIALPILFVVYVLIELMEHKFEVKFEKVVASSKKYGPLWGSVLGLVPQCGFSAIMADLFSRKMITIGTLFAVFVATSDEAIAIFLSEPEQIAKNLPTLLILLASKFILAVIIGYTFDLIVKQRELKKDNLEHNSHYEHEHSHNHNESNLENKDAMNCEVCEDEKKTCDTCAHEHLHHTHELEDKNKSKTFWHIVWQGTKHTLEIFAWILIANIVLTVIVQLLGGPEIMENIVGKNKWYQPFITALLGLIPNCAGSVAIVKLYMDGYVSFASCLGGLCTGAGVGLIILFKNNKNAKQNLLIMLILFLIGVIVGAVLNLFLPFRIIS